MREISKPEWSAFFDVFSQEHLNWRVTLEVLSRECGARAVFVKAQRCGPRQLRAGHMKSTGRSRCA